MRTTAVLVVRLARVERSATTAPPVGPTPVSHHDGVRGGRTRRQLPLVHFVGIAGEATMRSEIRRKSQPMCRTASRLLAPRPESVTAGRHFVERALAEWGVTQADPAGQILPETLLVVTELLANAVAVSTGEVDVALAAHRDHILLSVSDDNPAPAVPRGVGPEVSGGRGLGIVAALSQRWGQSGFSGTSKTVWADIAVGRGSVLARGCTEEAAFDATGSPHGVGGA